MFEIWKLQLKNTQFIVSQPKYWQSSVVTLTFDLLTPKCIGIFLLPSCMYVWNMKAVHWKLLKLSCQNQSVDGQCWQSPDVTLTFWLQNMYVENFSNYCFRTKVLTDRQKDRLTNPIPIGHPPHGGALINVAKLFRTKSPSLARCKEISLFWTFPTWQYCIQCTMQWKRKCHG